MKQIVFFFVVLLAASACMKGQKVDTIIYNGKIHTMDNGNKIVQAIAIRDGKIVEVGPDRQIQNKYRADEFIDAKGKDIYPGLTDAHGHLMLLIQSRLGADLTGSASMDEMLVRVEKFASKSAHKIVIGRGWDQSVWKEDFPDNSRLNALFPDRPVILFRIDAHAVLVNDAALKLAGISSPEKVEGGEIVAKEGKCTGLLIDNAMEKILPFLPVYTDKEKTAVLQEIEQELFQYGITSVHEAGITADELKYLQKVTSSGEIQFDIYAMLWPEKENIDFARKNGVYRKNNLTVRSFKVIGDGSLGSRGACLKQPYTDAPHTHGFLTTTAARMKEIAEICQETGYQMNIHAIGDSTNKMVIDLLTEVNKVNQGHRWRIEHAQVLSSEDIQRLPETGAFPSVQPLHAVSDYRWAVNRLGEERLKTAYAYRTILDKCGMIAIGTDFPVEHFDPFATIHAAVERKDIHNMPAAGFQKTEGLTLDECLKGMTIWPAYASFSEERTGSLEEGKEATFVIFETKVKSSAVFRENYSYMTFVKGKKVYSAE